MITLEEFSQGLVIDSAQMYLECRYRHNLPAFARSPDCFVKTVRTFLETSARGKQLDQSPLWLRDLVSQFPELVESLDYRQALYGEMEAWASNERERRVPEVASNLRAVSKIAPSLPLTSSERKEEGEPRSFTALSGLDNQVPGSQAPANPAVDPLANAIFATTGTPTSSSQIAAYRRIPA